MLRAFVRRGLLAQSDGDTMGGWDHGGGFLLDAVDVGALDAQADAAPCKYVRDLQSSQVVAPGGHGVERWSGCLYRPLPAMD